jgi:hypothetical protein
MLQATIGLKDLKGLVGCVVPPPEGMWTRNPCKSDFLITVFRILNTAK